MECSEINNSLSKDSIYLCDTPGFGDQNSVEVDIANMVGIISAIRGSRSVRPVILISSYAQGDRM